VQRSLVGVEGEGSHVWSLPWVVRAPGEPSQY
jgi:hypothetical protein